MSALEKSYKFLWGLMIPLALTSCAILVLSFESSDRYLKPKIWAYDWDEEVIIFTRTVEEDLIAEFTHEIITVDGLQCSVSGRTFYSKTNGPETVTYPIDHELLPCLEASGYRHTIAWNVIKYGGIRLKEVVMEFTKVDEQLDLDSFKAQRERHADK